MAGVCPAPSPDDGLIAGLLSSVDCNVRTLSETAYGALAQSGSPMSGVLTALLTLYIAFIGFRLLIGRAPLRVGDLTLSMLKIGAVLALATNWPTYQQLVFDTLFRGPEQLASGLLDAVQPSGSALGGDPFSGLQTAYDEMLLSAAYFTQHALGTASPLTGGAAGAALALNASALLMLLTSVGVVLAAKIVLGVLLGLGPVFVAMLLFDATRGVFEGWLRASLAFALAPLVAVLGLVVQLTLLSPHLLRLAELRAQGLTDVAPANAVFLLTLICTGVSLALAAAVCVVAFSLRLPQWGVPVQTGDRLAAPAPGTASVESRTSAFRQVEPRAAAVAAAATAMDRRESRLLQVNTDSGRRLRVGAGRTDGATARAFTSPAEQRRRQAAQPRQAASSVRRDR